MEPSVLIYGNSNTYREEALDFMFVKRCGPPKFRWPLGRKKNIRFYPLHSNLGTIFYDAEDGDAGFISSDGWSYRWQDFQRWR